MITQPPISQTGLPKARCAAVRFLLFWFLVFACIATLLQAAIAQSAPRGGPLPLSLIDVVPADFVRDAFAQPYGRALATEFAAVLRDSTDPKCLKTKKISAQQLEDRAHAILVRRGTYLLGRLIATIDRSAFKAYAPARIGRDGLAQIERLERDSSVQAYLKTEKPVLLAYVASYILENVDRYALLLRIKFVRPVSPFSINNKSLTALDPTEKTEAKLKEMVASDKSGVLERYLGITAAAQKALDDAIDPKAARNLGPGELLADPNKNREGLHNDLANLCIRE